jgi:hypothetical protein
MCASCACGDFATLRENPTPLTCRRRELMPQFICSDLGGVDQGRGGLHAAPNLVSQLAFLLSSVITTPSLRHRGVRGWGNGGRGRFFGRIGPNFSKQPQILSTSVRLHMRCELFCDCKCQIAVALAGSARLRERDPDQTAGPGRSGSSLLTRCL